MFDHQSGRLYNTTITTHTHTHTHTHTTSPWPHSTVYEEIQPLTHSPALYRYLTHTHTHTHSRGGSSLWACEQLWIIVFTDGIRTTCGLRKRERERERVSVLTKEDLDDIYAERLSLLSLSLLSLSPLSSLSSLTFNFFASFNYFTSVSLIGISGNEALTAKAEQWTVA